MNDRNGTDSNRTGLPMGSGVLVALALVLGWLAPQASAQFGTPGSTDIRQRMVGVVVSGEGDPEPQGGDQIAAIFNNEVVGLFVFEGVDPDPDFNIVIFGDDPETEIVEGPRFGQQVTFRYFQSSTSNTINMTPVNASGQDSTYFFQGEALPDFPVILPGFDLTPVRQLDLRFGSGGGGAGVGEDQARFDVNGDGRIDQRDVALVLSVVIGNTTEQGMVSAADINGDGVVSTQDGIAIMRAIRR